MAYIPPKMKGVTRPRMAPPGPGGGYPGRPPGGGDTIEPWAGDRNPGKPGLGWGRGGRFGGQPPDLNGPQQRGLGYGGLYNGQFTQPGGPPRPPKGEVRPPQTPDAFAQFNAWQDPNIAGQQPGPIQAGYGGFGALDTMTQTKLNNYLNQFETGGEREQMMNQLGYFNAGNPYDPQVEYGHNRGMRQQARSGAYTTPGVYQHQSLGPETGDVTGRYDWGGYTGITNVGQDLSAQYTPFDINRRYSGRTRRRGSIYGNR